MPMISIRIRRLVYAAMLFASAGAPAQQRVVEPLPSLAPLVEQVAPAVVNISVEAQRRPSTDQQLFERFFDFENVPDRPRVGAGSGVIVDAARGFVLTNHHVVAEAEQITVTLNDNRTFDAEIIGSDRDSDLAVLRIETGDLTEITMAQSNDLRVGDYVVAIGNPFGFANTVTSGIVSGLGRTVGRDRDAYQDFIQTDASINPGNSGGALVNLRGELVGINSAIVSATGVNAGVGFAIPIGMASSVMNQLIDYGEVRRGQLGIYMVEMTPSLADDCGLAVTRGARVTSVFQQSAAEAAGIRVQDIIVRVGSEQIDDSNELRNIVGLMQPGEQVEIEIIRDGRSVTTVAELGVRIASPPRSTESLDAAFAGVVLEERGNRLAPTIGLVVVAVDPASEAAARGLRAGDVITEINDSPFRDRYDADVIVASGCSVELDVERDGQSQLIRLR